MSHYRVHSTLCKTSTCKRLHFRVNILSFCTILCILNKELPAPHPGSCWAIKVQSIIFGLVLTHQHTHDQHCVCACEEGVSSLWYGGLSQPWAQQWLHWGGHCPTWPGMDGVLWRSLGGWRGCFLVEGVVMHWDPEPCSCRLARSGLGENRQLISMPSVLVRPMAGASVIVGHLEEGG